MNFNQILLITASLMGLCLSQQSHALSCGDIITTNTVMTADLHCTSGYYALEIQANNVTLDMNGHTLSGTNDLVGISVYSQDKVTIRGGGAITGFWVGINASSSDVLEVDDITFYDSGNGVIISSGSHALIKNNDFIKMSAEGVRIANHVPGLVANNNSVINNEFYQNFVGIVVCGDDSDRHVFQDNLILKSQSYGIHLIQSNRNQISSNQILDSGTTAMRLNNASYNTIKSNSLRIGRVGLSILADAGGRCLDTGSKTSYKNQFIGNHSIDFDTGIVVGVGLSSNDDVTLNYLNYNKLYDNDLGIFFNTDAHYNDATDNTYTGTLTEVSDVGVGNSY
ncbi:NosD domain-containing protein [Marinicella litoralis]|uniref:Parallel beta-helix repeat protein n=1 Tax=Marinicella litoralis TaxID=644220 RepID=A0A4R6XPR1_9GAMM|nr:right-handed parallel beta-helix repeat-containing protein [Marinicella litoralis]TDR20389.1 parallel beta-helix repeat protein [Marinicella litoralis]